MTADAKRLATELLDAQVAWALAELSAERLAQVVARDVDDLLRLAESITVAQLVDREQVADVLHRLLVLVAGSPLAEQLGTDLADALYDLAASEEHRLGDVVPREPVAALIAKVLSMQPLHERAMQRLSESPLVAAVAAKFVASIVNDFVAQNRQLAERLPGAKSLFSLGQSAASRVVRNTPLLGEAAERGTQLAIRRTNNAMRSVIKEAPLQGAALEIWDLHAGEPISELRAYLSRSDLRELVRLGREIVLAVRDTEYARAVLDECVAVFFERYGERDVAGLLAELDVDRDTLVADLTALLPRLVEAARADGRLEQVIRDRLAPFYASERVVTLLGGQPGKPRPAKS